jgi:hypothetical protein
VASCVIAMDDLIQSYQFFKAEKSREGWFTNQDLVNQFNKIEQLIKDFHEDCDILITFDNSMIHHAKVPNGLDVKNLKLKPGLASTANGIFMRDGWFIKDGVKLAQSMFFTNAVGVNDQKGAREILSEKGKSKKPGTQHDLNMQCYPCKKKIPRVDPEDPDYSRSDSCCASYVLSQEPDFLGQRECLIEVVEAVGFEISFYLKYHCELNYIEMIWGCLKSYQRRNCTCIFKDPETTLPSNNR